MLIGLFGSKYKWNVDSITNLKNKLSGEKSQLETDSSNISSLKSDIKEAWQSVAGTNYTGSIDIDEQDIKNLVTRMDNVESKLSRVGTIYTNAESDIRREINTMKSRIIR